MTTAPRRMPRICRSSITLAKSRMLTIKPMKMARPPSRGMGTLCIRRASLGTSTAPTLYAKLFTAGVRRKLTTSAVSSARTT